MPRFSERSLKALATCDVRLQAVLNRAIEQFDFTVLCGHRGKAEQDGAYLAGRSKVRFPNSKHNSEPAKAVDCAPYPIDWSDTERFREMAAVIKKAAMELGVSLAWGGDWKKFRDMPHFELKSA